MTTIAVSSGPKLWLENRTVLAWLTTLLIILFLFVDPLVQFSILGAMLLLSILLARQGYVSLRSILTGLQVLISMLAVTVILQGFLQEGRTVLFSFPLFRWRAAFTLEGLTFGFVMASRFVSISIGFMIFFMTTSAYDLCQSLYKLGIPFKYAYLVPMALDRFPRMVELMQTIETAQATRGYELETGSAWQKIKNLMPILIPLVIFSLREAGNMSIALELKGFGRAKRVSFLRDRCLSSLDRVLIVLAAVTLLAGVAIKIRAALG